MRYIFYIFIYIFLCNKSFFSVKIFFNIKLFFHIKRFISASNAYLVKNKNICSKKNCFFQLSFATNEQPYMPALLQIAGAVKC